MMLLIAFGIFVAVAAVAYALTDMTKPSGQQAHTSQGVAYWWKQDVVRTKHSSYLKHMVGMEVNHPIDMQIVKERWYHKCLKGLGLCEEFQTGHPEFDRGFFLIGENRALSDEFRQSEEARGAVTQLFSHPLKVVNLRGNKLWIEMKTSTSWNEPTAYNDIATQLDIIKRHLAPVVPSSYGHKELASSRAHVVSSMHAALIITAIIWVVLSGFMTKAHTLDHDRMLHDAAWAASPIVLLWLFALMVIFCRTSRLPKLLAEFLIAGIAGIAVLTYLTIKDINWEFDRTQGVAVQTPIEGKRTHTTTGKKRKTHYYISFGAAGSYPAREVQVSRGEYDLAQKGRFSTLTYRQGALGYAWLEPLQF